jgi:hypothetical protein
MSLSGNAVHSGQERNMSAVPHEAHDSLLVSGDGFRFGVLTDPLGNASRLVS